jgi:3-hydroxybutyryl-CoA dehydrogenase
MVQTICICGSGTMGSGIAQTAAQHGLNTILFDVQPAALEKARAGIEKNLQHLADKQKLTDADRQQILGRIRYASSISECRADVIIEAIIEKLSAKTNLLNQLAEVNGEHTILATNTSSLSVTDIAQAVLRPERVIGMHFFNPATIMKLVEVVQTTYTNEQTTTQIVALARRMGKTPVLCKDAPGFIVNHVARPYYLESLKLVEMGIADYETVDRLLEATGFKMGPFRLMDLIGNDINYAVSCQVYEALGKPERLQPSPLQKEKVDAGALGRKTGNGYYVYPAKQ